MRIQRLTKETMQNLLKELLKRSPDSYGEYEDRVAAILKNVKETEIRRSFPIRAGLIMQTSQRTQYG